eukprot:864218-Alexandrium_andersonii.AAC.1
MSASLVGSEMCIRDRRRFSVARKGRAAKWKDVAGPFAGDAAVAEIEAAHCLLYTSDAADDM